jgi:hypothetical protein
MRYTVNGTKWEHVASSAHQFKCADRRAATSRSNSVQSISQEAMPSEREAERIFSFVDMSCLFPYYMITAGAAVYGSSFVIASVLAVTEKWQGVVNIIYWSNVICGIVRLIALGCLASDTRSLPFGPISECLISCICVCVCVCVCV